MMRMRTGGACSNNRECANGSLRGLGSVQPFVSLGPGAGYGRGTFSVQPFGPKADPA